MLVCHIHTGKDEDGTDKEIDGDLLGKYQPGENDGDNPPSSNSLVNTNVEPQMATTRKATA